MVNSYPTWFELKWVNTGDDITYIPTYGDHILFVCILPVVPHKAVAEVSE